MKNKTVLITGGSSGIGFEISKRFANDGYRLLWVSLLQTELDEAKAKLLTEFPTVEIYTLEKDLSIPTNSKNIYDWVKESGWTVDVLINNAGFGNYGFTNDIPIEKELAAINLNIVNLFQMTRYFLKEMVERDSGTIINISSNSSFQPTMRLNVYASTKAFVSHFTQGLTDELRLMKSNVTAITICPSAINNTAFRTKNGMQGVKTFEGLAYTTKEEVAKDVWKAFQKKKTFQVTGWKMRIIYATRNLVPAWLMRILMKMETDKK